MSNRNHAIRAGLVASALLTAPAIAEPLEVVQTRGHLVPAYEVVTIVRSTGLRPIGPAVLRGRHYVVRAADFDGREMRVMVDARLGEVVTIAPLFAPPRAIPPGPRIATMPSFLDDRPVMLEGPAIYGEPPPRPPRIVRAAPDVRAPIVPRKPPLPRPKPADLAALTGASPVTSPSTTESSGAVAPAEIGTAPQSTDSDVTGSVPQPTQKWGPPVTPLE